MSLSPRILCSTIKACGIKGDNNLVLLQVQIKVIVRFGHDGTFLATGTRVSNESTQNAVSYLPSTCPLKCNLKARVIIIDVSCIKLSCQETLLLRAFDLAKKIAFFVTKRPLVFVYPVHTLSETACECRYPCMVFCSCSGDSWSSEPTPFNRFWISSQVSGRISPLITSSCVNWVSRRNDGRICEGELQLSIQIFQ